MNSTVEWLLEDNNPAVSYRTKTELLNIIGDSSAVSAWLRGKLPSDWQSVNGLWYIYYLTAFAECGLTYKDVGDEQIDKAMRILRNDFDFGCSDFMLLRALVKLGCRNELVNDKIRQITDDALPDGGFLCGRRRAKLDYTPKSCYKADLHALMLASECRKKNIDCPFTDGLVQYFIRHNLFYRESDKTRIILDGRVGWRTVDTFFPFEPMRVGIQNVVEALCALGYGNDKILDIAWKMLDGHDDGSGKIILDGTLTKSYLPKLKAEKPDKWVTFYTMLAKKQCE